MKSSTSRIRNLRVGILIMLGSLVALELICWGLLQLLFLCGVITEEAKVRSRADADAYHGKEWAEEYFREFEESYVTVWKPYVYWRRQGYEGEHITVSGEGIRRTWGQASSQESSAAQRIFFFGGSTLWGSGARDEFTIPSLVAKGLKEASPGQQFEIINFGESGYVSTQELIRFLLLLREGNRPELAVFYHGVNDSLSGYQRRRAGIPLNEENRYSEFNLLKPERSGDLLRHSAQSLVSISSTFKLVGVVVQRLRGYSPGLPSFPKLKPEVTDPLASEVAKTYLANKRTIQVLGKEHGVQTLFFLQPHIFRKNILTEYEKEQAATVFGLGDLLQKSYSHILAAPSARAEFGFTDLSSVFLDVKEPLYIDSLHVEERGNKLVADKITSAILEFVKSSSVQE